MRQESQKSSVPFFYVILGVYLAMSCLAGCARNPASPQAEQCRTLLEAAYADLDKANSSNFSGAADVTSAAALLSAASIQRQFSKYPNCIDKAERARALLRPYVK